MQPNVVEILKVYTIRLQRYKNYKFEFVTKTQLLSECMKSYSSDIHHGSILAENGPTHSGGIEPFSWSDAGS